MVSRTPRILSVILIALILLLMFGLVYSISNETRLALKGAEEDKLLAVASTTASQIDGNSFARISTGGENTPEFMYIRDQLVRVKQETPDIHYIYTMRKNGTTAEFVVDGDYGYKPDAATIGQAYPQAGPALFNGFTAPTADKEFTTDQWGTILSGFAPIRDSSGKVVGIVGIDMDSTTVINDLNHLSLIIYLIGIIASIAAVSGISVIEYRRSHYEQIVEASERKYRLLFERAGDAIFLIEAEGENRGKIVAANKSAADMHGYMIEELQHLNITDLETPEERSKAPRYFDVILSGEWLHGERAHRKKDGVEFPVESSAGMLDLGTKKYILAFNHDITKRKHAQQEIQKKNDALNAKNAELNLAYDELRNREHVLADKNRELAGEIAERKQISDQLAVSLKDREVLLKEVYHRVKNNFQVISSLINMQGDHIEDPKAKALFLELQNKVKSIALIHQKLYQSSSLSQIDYGEYLRIILLDVFDSYNVDKNVGLRVNADKALIDMQQAVSCTLIVNEMLSNAFKHAFPGGRKGRIEIRFRTEGGNHILTYSDNGVGIPQGVTFERTESLGMSLIAGLTRQLRGEIAIGRDGGTQYTLTFPAVQGKEGTSKAATPEIVDIVDYKRVMERNRQLALIVDSSADAILSESLDGIITSWNTGAERMYGYHENEIIGKPVLVLVPPDQRDDLQVILNQVREGGLIEHHETVHIRKDGVKIPVSLTVSPLRNASGIIIGISAIAQDIAARKHAEDALRESEEMFRKPVEHSPVGIYVVQDNAIHYANPKLAELLGYTLEDLHMMPLEKVIFAGDRLIIRTMLEQMLRGEGGGAGIELHGVRKDGSLVDLVAYGSTMTYHGRPAIFGTIIDNTDRKRAEEQIALSLREKEILLAEVHHRIKNNMQVITSILAMEEDKIRDPAVRAIFRKNENRIRAIASVHELAYKSTQFAQISLEELVKKISSSVIYSLQGDKPTVSLDIHVDELMLDLDHAVPFGILINELVTNAVIYAFPDKRMGTVTITLKKDADKMVVLFADDGVGYPPDVDFEYPMSAGLELIRGLTRQLRGTVEKVNRPGTAYRFVFPLT
jgi:PAS domain S-box-containing protein